MVPRVLRKLNRSRRLKRAIDIAVAGSGLIGLSPLLLCTMGAVVVRHGWPPLFIQHRPGKDCKIFAMYKFRSMTNERDEHGKLLPDAQRMTRLGRFLRSTSIDELPELWNVFRGDMSLVGPRPLLVEYLPLYSPHQARRHEVPPGITGLAQVRGRNAISWEAKFRYDVEYVDDWSNWRDIIILVETGLIVIRRDGIQHGGEATMPVFKGTSCE